MALYILQRIHGEEFAESAFFIFSKVSACLFLTLAVIVPSSQFFAILENFDIQLIIEGLDINPNFRKQNEDYSVNFDMKF